MQRHIVRFLLLLSLAIVFPMSAWAGGEVWKTFVKYKESLTAEARNAGSYFSEEVKEEWFRYLFKKHPSAEDALATLGAVRSRSTFARRVHSIYRTSEKTTSEDTAELSFVFKESDSTGPFTYTIGYVREDGSWKINMVSLDKTRPEGIVPIEPVTVFQ